MSNATKPQEFQAEVGKLLHMMVHSVYSDREIFLRELISNASDALDKLRYEAIATPSLLESEPDLKITLAANKEAKTLTVTDSGIGMSAEELTQNLGTIARSGTQKFSENTKDAPQLIGQFGVGFYAAFMVAKEVEVVSRKAGSDQANVWRSNGEGTFTVEESSSKTRGTKIVLHLRDDAQDFLENWKIEQIIKTYSDHITHPIFLDGEKEAKQINSASALWMQSKSNVTPEQHKLFYNDLSHTSEAPALTIHYRAEGKQEYNVLLYVPAEKPFDLYDAERKGRQKLYVKRVFIADDANLLPPYLRFVRGVVDSSDMPLNLSREMLQNNPDVAAIRKAVTNRCLSELKKLSESDKEAYAKIWNMFGSVLKEGLYEDWERRDSLFDVARFKTTKRELISLKEYVADLKENQTAIYYLTAETPAKALSSPQLEGFKARDLEVLLLTDPVDSFWIRTAMGFEGKSFKSVAQGASDLDAMPTKGGPDEAKPAALNPSLIASFKQALGNRVSDVRASNRLTDSVCCIVNDGDMDRTLEKYLARQQDSGVTVSAPVLEVNASHPLIKALSANPGKDMSEIANLLLDQATILEGETLSDPVAFAKRLDAVLLKAFA